MFVNSSDSQSQLKKPIRVYKSICPNCCNYSVSNDLLNVIEFGSCSWCGIDFLAKVIFTLYGRKRDSIIDYGWAYYDKEFVFFSPSAGLWLLEDEVKNTIKIENEKTKQKIKDNKMFSILSSLDDRLAIDGFHGEA